MRLIQLIRGKYVRYMDRYDRYNRYTPIRSIPERICLVAYRLLPILLRIHRYDKPWFLTIRQFSSWDFEAGGGTRDLRGSVMRTRVSLEGSPRSLLLVMCGGVMADSGLWTHLGDLDFKADCDVVRSSSFLSPSPSTTLSVVSRHTLSMIFAITFTQPAGATPRCSYCYRSNRHVTMC